MVFDVTTRTRAFPVRVYVADSQKDLQKMFQHVCILGGEEPPTKKAAGFHVRVFGGQLIGLCPEHLTIDTIAHEVTHAVLATKLKGEEDLATHIGALTDIIAKELGNRGYKVLL